MLLGMELINNSLCPARLMLSLNVVLVSLEPFWYPIKRKASILQVKN